MDWVSATAAAGVAAWTALPFSMLKSFRTNTFALITSPSQGVKASSRAIALKVELGIEARCGNRGRPVLLQFSLPIPDHSRYIFHLFPLRQRIVMKGLRVPCDGCHLSDVERAGRKGMPGDSYSVLPYVPSSISIEAQMNP
jgi:hypothetical protein